MMEINTHIEIRILIDRLQWIFMSNRFLTFLNEISFESFVFFYIISIDNHR